MDEFPWTADRIRDVVETLQSELRRDPTALIDASRNASHLERSAQHLQQSAIPFYFELWPPARKTGPNADEYLHYYDEDGRLCLVAQRNHLGRTTFTAFERKEGRIGYWTIDEWRSNRKIIRAGQISLTSDGGHDISILRPSDIIAYVWTSTENKPTSLQIWNLRQPSPRIIDATYDGDVLSFLEESGKKIWQRTPKSESGLGIDDAARKLVKLAQIYASNSSEPLLLLTLCFELNNIDYLPPQIGAVFLRDAEAFARTPDRYEHDINSLLNPTLQESLIFPTNTAYPAVTILPEALHLAWPASRLKENATALVDRANELLAGTELAFVLVDLEGDSREYLARLPSSKRNELTRLGLLEAQR